jgi:predicted O-methyltransferase YrrM
MQFEHAYEHMIKFQADNNGWFVHQSKAALRGIYQHIIATRAKDCLELGTAFGATACVMAAAVEEIGGGLVTTVDRIERIPVGIAELANAVSLGSYIRPVVHDAGYNWFLLHRLREHTTGRTCEPCYDFCFLDGAHVWEPDALAALLVVRLLRPGGWLLLDDLHWHPKDHPGWQQAFAQLSQEELETRAVGQVFDLVLKPHPALSHFVLSNEGHMGWCRKAGGPPLTRLPGPVLATAVQAGRSITVDGAVAAVDSALNHNVALQAQGRATVIRATGTDPWLHLALPAAFPPIAYVTLRLRLLSPDIAMMQLFWLNHDAGYFSEDCSLRCLLRRSHGAQELTFCIAGSEHVHAIRGLRLDPADDTCELLLESVTFGAW